MVTTVMTLYYQNYRVVLQNFFFAKNFLFRCTTAKKV